MSQVPEFIEQQLDIAFDALRRVGAFVEFIPEKMRVQVITDSLEALFIDDKNRILVDDKDMTNEVRSIIIDMVEGDFPRIRVLFKPKITITKGKL